MKAVCILAAILNMFLTRSLTTRVSSFSRRCSLPKTSLRAFSTTSELCSVAKDNWTEYMIEFRGIQSAFRLNELRDAYNHVMNGTDEADIILTSIIADVLFPEVPICAYVRLPNDTIAIDITKRCSLVRSISQVWGDGSTFDGAREEAERKYDALISPHFNNGLNDNSWRVDFRRYGRSGRSGLDPEGKKNVLSKFSTIFKKMDSQVDLFTSKHNLLYLEDWSTYRPWVDRITTSKMVNIVQGNVEINEMIVNDTDKSNDKSNDNSKEQLKVENGITANYNNNSKNNNNDQVAKLYRSRISYMADAPIALQSQLVRRSTSEDQKEREKEEEDENDNLSRSDIKKNKSNKNSNNNDKSKNATLSVGEINHDDGTYVPLRFIFGRIIAEGPNVVSDFDLRRRPYLGRSVTII